MKQLLTLIVALVCASANAEAPRVVVDTTMGKIVVELDADKAPVTVANFLKYVDQGAYDGNIFHRVIEGFMIQGGGHLPSMDELPDDGMIKNEADNGLQNVTGTIAMARMDEIDSASRQFYINVADNHFLDHSAQSCTREDQKAQQAARERGLSKPVTCKSFGYAVFGHVVEGMDVVHAIEGVNTHIFKGSRDVPAETVLINSIKREVEKAEKAEE